MWAWGWGSGFRLGVSSRSRDSSGFKGRVNSQVRVSSRDGELSIRTSGWGLGLRVSSSHGLSAGAWVQVQGSVSGPGVGLDLKSGSWAQGQIQGSALSPGLWVGFGFRAQGQVWVGLGVGTQGWGLGLDMCQLHGPGLIVSSGVGTPESGVSSRVRGSELGLVVRANSWVQGPGRWQGSRSGAQGQNEDWGFRVGSGAPETGAEWGLQGLV